MPNAFGRDGQPVKAVDKSAAAEDTSRVASSSSAQEEAPYEFTDGGEGPRSGRPLRCVASLYSVGFILIEFRIFSFAT